ncbi:MAG: helix-turn-helix transcriptional regulator [Acinetobacter sp.]
MDKRFRPMSGLEEIKHRQQVIATILEHPEWSIQQTIRYLRTELHITLGEMSELTKIPVQTLQKMEQTESNPTLNTLMKLLRPFGLSLIIAKKPKSSHS